VRLRTHLRNHAVRRPADHHRQQTRVEKGRYKFKDKAGRPSWVPAGRVKEIAPASMVEEQKPMFNAQPKTK